jgi:hypothetical protein
MSRIHRFLRGQKCIPVILVLAGMAISAQAILAGTIALSNQNSQVTIDPVSGITDWTLDSTSYTDSQALLYRTGGTGSQQSWVYSGGAAFSTTLDSVQNGAVLTYTGDGGLTLTETFILFGSQPGSGSSNLSEQIQITNPLPTAVDLQLYQYNNLALGGGSATLRFLSPSDVEQSGNNLKAELLANAPTAHQAANSPFLSGFPLTNADGPVVGNPASAMEWDVHLGGNRSTVVGQQYSLNAVPEPSTLMLFTALAGSVPLAAFCRRRRGA